MARAQLVNSAITTLSAAITATTPATGFTFSVASGGGSLFPSTGYFYVTLLDSANVPEIVKVTSRTGDVFTVNRGQDNTSPRTFNSAARVSLNITAVVLNELAPIDNPTFTGTVTSPAFSGPLTGAWSYLPTGTRAPFAQAAAPTGWTRDVTDAANNRMLRVVSTGGGGVGGSSDPTINNIVAAHTHSFTTDTRNIDHTHSDAGHYHSTPIQLVGTTTAGGAFAATSGGYQTTIGLPNNGGGSGPGYANIQAMNGNQTHYHQGTTDGNSNQGNWTPRYIDMIICAKD